MEVSASSVSDDRAALFAESSGSSSSSREEKDGHCETIQPDRVPQQAIRLYEQDCSFRHITVCHCVRGVPDADQLQKALQRAITKNPAVAGRLRPFWLRSQGLRPDGLEIAFDGPVGCKYQVQPMVPELEDEIDRLDAERYARRFLHVHSALADELGIDHVRFALDLIGKDRPLCIATFCPGKRVSVIALSISRVLGEASAINGLLRCWDEEYACANSSSSLPGGGGLGAGTGGREVLKLLYKPIVALQAIHEALDGVRHWVYQTTVWGFGGCCAARGGAGSNVPGRIGLLAPSSNSFSSVQNACADNDGDDDAPEDREFYALAVRVREETMASIRAASAASAPVGAAGGNGNSVCASDALCAWLGNVLRANQLLIANRGTGAEPQTGSFFGHGSPFVAYSPPGGPGRCHALGIRRSFNNASLRAFPGSSSPSSSASPTSAQQMGTGELPDSYVSSAYIGNRNCTIVDVLMEVQYFPHFGTDAHYMAFELHDLWQRVPRHSVARCSQRDYLVFHCVCQRDQVLALQRSWRRVGEAAFSVASEAQLLEAAER
eukprot:CAMPEP_0197658128 /NCGR_PEP_ID=MMETSP1338-20131121/45046_1 /TAXON_ID=43686 ORGANISM="Pelagodinium beii, Strain RCC1491" /NCGR_SAMPLE_ID=MMETSP1338 /ASSEMBLY_ACC=CAM_ASM_000754 /LENGTH=550 /DNA_ID=CAMNT_0043234649 /DNA_START=42 /DNA_END=1694 /DNA_ORIENTATION=+